MNSTAARLSPVIFRQRLSCGLIALAALTGCAAEPADEPDPPQHTADTEPAADPAAEPELPRLLLSGHGMEIPIITSPDDLDRHVGQVVAVRGPVGNTKSPTIIGVEVTGGQNLPDACAVGMLGKFVTTEEDREAQKHRGLHGRVAGSFGPGTRYMLYSSLEGAGAEPQPWGTGYTARPETIHVPAHLRYNPAWNTSPR